MSIDILMPALSPTMEEGTLAKWHVKVGDTVKAGDVIAEIETDKATMEVEAVDEGVIEAILVEAGTENVKVNAQIAKLAGEGESPAPPPAKPAPAAEAPKVASAAPVQAAGETAAPAKPAPAIAPTGDRVFASPLARRLASAANLDLKSIAGTGPHGRVVKADVEAAQKGAPQAAQPTAQPAAPLAKATQPVVTAPHTAVPNSSIRKIIARRLTEAKATIPHFYVSMDVEIDALLKLVNDLNARSPAEGADAYKLSVNDLVIKASAAALRRVPKVNASWTDDAILQYEDVDISVAVAIPDGLITPVMRRADQKGLATISREMKELIGRARAGKLKPEEYQGGGFSISNMGMYGVSEFAAIINPPQAAILAVAAGQKRPVVRNDSLAIATVMTCTLSVDHRVVDGALGSEWLRAFKQIVEDPLSLML
jgi:pyruvate dehydrogenase E2 component (dihydrolipoamide acetyltransferase)